MTFANLVIAFRSSLVSNSLQGRFLFRAFPCVGGPVNRMKKLMNNRIDHLLRVCDRFAFPGIDNQSPSAPFELTKCLSAFFPRPPNAELDRAVRPLFAAVTKPFPISLEVVVLEESINHLLQIIRTGKTPSEAVRRELHDLWSAL